MCKWLRAACLAFSLALLAGFLLAQTSAKEPSTKDPSTKSASEKPDYSTEALIYESFVTKVVLENDGTGSREQTVRIRVQSDAGLKQAGVLTFPYESFTSTVDLTYVRVRKPDGTVVATPTENILDMPSEITREAPFYSDLHEKQVAVKGLSQGDVLEYQCRWQTAKPLIPNQFWSDYRFAKDGIVLNEELELRFPSQRAVKLKSPDFKPEISEQNGYKVYHWKSSNLENKKKEENGEQAWQAATGRLPQPDVRLSSFQSWEEIGRWYGGLQQERVKPSAQVQAKAAELTKGLTSDDAKLHALYSFVATRFRYIGVAFGIGRYQPHAAEDVLGNQYGDCKDKHTLLASLLFAAGIKAYPALINAQYELDSDVPSPSQFNHVITAVPQKDGYLWLDTTPEIAPYGLLMSGLRDKHALVIPEGAAPVLAVTPSNPPYPLYDKFSVEGKLGDDGVLKAKFELIDRSEAEVILRSAFRRTPQPKWKELVQNISRFKGFGGTVDDVDVSSPENLNDPFRYSYSYDRKDYSDWSNRRITPPLPPILVSGYTDEVKKLTAPIFLGSPGEIVYRAHVELPKEFSPAVPSALTVTRSFAEYHATYEIKDHVLTAERRLTLKSRTIPPEKYEEFKSFAKAIADDEGHYIELSAGSDAASKNAEATRKGFESLPETANPEARRLEEESRAEFRNRDIKSAVEKLERALVADPTAVRVQVMLASTYMGTDRQEEGLRIFRQALEANPTQSYLYKPTAAALDHLKKFDESADLWKKYMKNFPEDADGPSNLAGSLYRLKRYREAAQAYEAAFKLNDKNAYLPMNMGRAYGKAGDSAKALTAFHKAVEIDSSSLMLNNIGYEMADDGLNISEALEYARKAVRQTSEESQKVELDGLVEKDLAYSRELPMYWDTLGWVYYRMGNPEQAEKYVSAAWKLEQDPVIGEHLGEILQKQKKTQAALVVFKQSLQVISSGYEEETEKIRGHIKELNRGKIPDKSPGTQTELNNLRTIKLSRLTEDQESADFFLSISPGGKIEKVKFISGSDKLKSATTALSQLKLDDPFPDDTPARLVRRGILGCYSTTGCALVLLAPTQVRSIN